MYLLFSMLDILLGGVGEMKMSVVGFLPKDDLLRSKHFTKFSSLTLTTTFLERTFGHLRLL
jgi:hypothetical protein